MRKQKTSREWDLLTLQQVEIANKNAYQRKGEENSSRGIVALWQCKTPAKVLTPRNTHQ
jgi:hypothetical protein